MGLKHIILVLALSGCTTYHINKHKGLDFDLVGKAIYFKGDLPEHIIFPVGNGGLFLGAWKGFKELLLFGLIKYI